MNETSPTMEGVLQERGKVYGSFKGHAAIAQKLKDVMRSYKNWEKLSPDQKECLEMWAHKIARVLNGNDVNFLDHWVDMEGYIKLVTDRMKADMQGPQEGGATLNKVMMARTEDYPR